MKAVRVLALITLGFLGVGALMGGISLILAPSGRLLHMPLSLLRHSPFHSFLIPGILLAVCNGLLCFVVFTATWRRTAGYGMLVCLQGLVIAGWIAAQVFFLQTIVWAHCVYWGVGLVLLACGAVLRHDRRSVGKPHGKPHLELR